jgi:hypothetical protein
VHKHLLEEKSIIYKYLRSLLYGISLGTVIIASLGAIFEVRELWITTLYFFGAFALAWVTYKSKV